VSNQLVQIFHAPYTPGGTTNEPPIRFQNDPLDKISRLTPENSEFNVFHYNEPEKNDYLFIEAVTFHFTPDYSHPLTGARHVGHDARFQFSVRGTLCELCIMSTDEQLHDLPKRTEQHFLLLAKDRGLRDVIYYLMLLEYGDADLKMKEGERGVELVAERKTVMEVIVSEGRLDVLEDLGMKIGRVVLR
jgi:hypothetical protein